MPKETMARKVVINRYGLSPKNIVAKKVVVKRREHAILRQVRRYVLG